MRLDLKENVEYPFSDPEWVAKLLKLSLCQLLGITAPIMAGYQLKVIREAAQGEDSKLPDLEDYGGLWIKGFVFALILCALMLIPTLGLGAVAVGGVMALGDNGAGAAIAVGMTVMIFIAIFLVTLLIPALTLRYAMTGSASSLFDVGAAISDMKQGPADYAVIWLVPFAGQMIAGLAGATGVGLLLLFPITVLIMIIQGRMLGNYYRAYFE